MNERRLLCVDDEKDICDLIARILESFEVIAAHSVRDAERSIGATKFDLLLLNSRLPDGSGLDLCRSIRKSDVSTPILLLVGGFAMREADIEKVGAQGCIYKGSRFFQELERKVNELFGEDSRCISRSSP